jgi:hypothetical protein
VQERIAEVEKALPFAILGFDSDDGGEFLNWHLFDYFHLRVRPVAFQPITAVSPERQCPGGAEKLDPRAAVGGLWPAR